MDIKIFTEGLSSDTQDNIRKLLNSFINNDFNIVENSSDKGQLSFIATSTISKDILAQINHFILVVRKGDSIDKSFFESDKCLGVYFNEKTSEENFLNIKNAVDGLRAIEEQKQLISKLNDVMENLVGQLQGVKDLHQTVAPFRKEKIRGLNITSRFCAGTSTGGEFFDFFKVGADVWLVSLYASSYILIGSFLSLIEDWKSQSSLSIEDIEKILNSKVNEFSEIGRSSIFIGKVSISELTLESINIGNHEILSEESVVVSANSYEYPSGFDLAKDKVKLEKGKSILMLSPGFFKNSNVEISGKNYKEFIKENWDSPNELISELTFQSKKRYDNDEFLPNDQTILMIEVDKNAISKI